MAPRRDVAAGQSDSHIPFKCCNTDEGSDADDEAGAFSLQSEDSSGDDDSLTWSGGESQRAVRSLMLPMLCVFQGYAAMVGPTQQKFKAELGIGQTGTIAIVFTQAAVFVHYGKLVARLGHDVAFGFLTPLGRVYLSMVLVLIGAMLPPLFVFDMHERWIGFVFLSYGLTGIGIGVFECTYLAVITPMGKLTKAWAIMGIPLGFGIVNILGLVCTSAGMPVSWLYWYIVGLLPVGMLTVRRNLGDKAAGGGPRPRPAVEQCGFGAAALECSAWLPLMLPHIVAKVLGNFVMENASPVSYYVYNAAEVPLWSPTSSTGLVKHDLYFAALGLFVMIADSVSRRIPASLTLATYSSNVLILVIALGCSVAGFVLESLAVAALAVAGLFAAFWGNGMVYGASAKFFDQSLPKEYNLVAYSLWCFMGDLGAIAGGVTVDVVRNWICGGHEYPYECVSHN